MQEKVSHLVASLFDLVRHIVRNLPDWADDFAESDSGR